MRNCISTRVTAGLHLSEQDFLMYYRYAQKWIDLFDNEPLMVYRTKTGHYVKGMHRVCSMRFRPATLQQVRTDPKKFEAYSSKTPEGQHHDNFRIHTWVYINLAKINQHTSGEHFRKGLVLVPEINSKLNEYSAYDHHRILVFNYKIATLYFGSGDYNTSMNYLHQIINDHVDLRYDLQCYARLVPAGIELGNYELCGIIDQIGIPPVREK